VLTMEILNSIEGEDITEEIMEEDDEHMFFFAFADELFTSPAGDGNVDERDDTAINYNDFDENMLPVGLNTSWETECGEEITTGDFRVILKHQPGVKSATSTVNDGGTDVDLTFTVNVNEDPDAPPCENEEEIITDVTLIFTPVDGGTPVTAAAQDPDGEGPLDLVVLDDIELVESTEYVLTMEILNSIEGEDITEEIMEEDDEHMFFFAFVDELFRSPAGDGNVDERDDTAVNYNDFDENMLPVGLNTSWETECGEEITSGDFRVILKHQPGVKSATSTVDDGGTDVDLTWTVNINVDPDAPPCENEEEVITDVVLTWTPTGGGNVVTAAAQDPDGEGPLDLEVLAPINLEFGIEYTMTVELFNSIEGEDITTEIMEEDDEHQFFFEFTDNFFADPTGDGNADNRDDDINYNDMDENMLPVGLSTNWRTTSDMGTGDFRIVLKHQPGIKSATSTINDGGTDVDLTFVISNDPVNVRDLEDRLNAELILAPNPARDLLNWQLNTQDINDPLEVRIITMTGQVVQTYSAQETQIDLSQLPAGSYIFQLQAGQAMVSKRFIKI
ncbi:MAG: T9SS type A sorting domain-containing protein, partial [Bacteroidota bacterium]